jgi:hypothetical protein
MVIEEGQYCNPQGKPAVMAFVGIANLEFEATPKHDPT